MHKKMYLFVCIYVHAYIRLLLLHHPHFSTSFSSLLSGSCVVYAMEKYVTTKLGVRVHSIYILRTKCCAPAIVMHWQLTSHLPIFSVLSAVGIHNALLVCVCVCFSNSVAWDFCLAHPTMVCTMHCQLL